MVVLVVISFLEPPAENHHCKVCFKGECEFPLLRYVQRLRYPKNMVAWDMKRVSWIKGISGAFKSAKFLQHLLPSADPF